MGNYVYSQATVYVKEKGYDGYIFPREHSIWGFPPEKGRYTPTLEDIAQAEKILMDSIYSGYMKSTQKAYKNPPINRKTLSKYMRQYVGYLTDSNEIVILVNLFKKGCIGNQKPAFDIISVQDGSYNFWSIRINITTKELSDMKVNGKN
jgi:hypothetical protein